MLRVVRIDRNHRGFQLGYVVGRHGYKAAWRSSLDAEWNEGHIYVDTIGEIEQLARDCIDFNYRIEAKEFELFRKLTLEEVMAVHDDKEQ